MANTTNFNFIKYTVIIFTVLGAVWGWSASYNNLQSQVDTTTQKVDANITTDKVEHEELKDVDGVQEVRLERQELRMDNMQQDIAEIKQDVKDIPHMRAQVDMIAQKISKL